MQESINMFEAAHEDQTDFGIMCSFELCLLEGALPEMYHTVANQVHAWHMLRFMDKLDARQGYH